MPYAYALLKPHSVHQVEVSVARARRPVLRWAINRADFWVADEPYHSGHVAIASAHYPHADYVCYLSIPAAADEAARADMRKRHAIARFIAVAFADSARAYHLPYSTPVAMRYSFLVITPYYIRLEGDKRL